MDEFDYIVVGAGSAGCVMADRLSADGRHTVLLLEAGGSDRRFWIKAPIGYGKTFFDATVNWKYVTEPEPELGNRSLYWPRGKVIGGSSSINAMVYCRGMPSDYDDWRDAGNPGWGWRDVQPVFDSFERHVDGDNTIRGNGALWVSHRVAEYHPIKRHILAAAREIGLPVSNDLNASEPEGIGAYDINTRNGMRCSSADAFLRPAMKRRNLVVRQHSNVERVVFEKNRAIGVDYVLDGASRTARARGEVVVSAGAVNTPKLLQLSGVGPGDLLRRMGIEVIHANDAVGGGLQDHIGINYYYRAKEPTLNGILGSWRGRLQAGLQYVLLRSGPLSLSVNQMGGMVRSSSALPRPDIQLYFNPLSYTYERAGKRDLFKPDPYPGFIMSFNPARPTATGRIDIAAPDPAHAPRIVPNSLSTSRDIADVIAGARLIGRFQQSTAMRALIDGAPVFDVAAASDDEILADFRSRSGTVFHACGTCRMAPLDRGGVVDPSLRVHGVERLRVVDASVFPNVTSANTNAPAIMVAHKAARAMTAGSCEV